MRSILFVFSMLLLTEAPAWSQVVGNPYLNEGLARYSQGNLEAAIPPLELALQSDSLLAQAYVTLGSAYLGTQQYRRAELLVRQGSRHFPELKALRVIQAEALMGRQEFEAALPLFKRIETDLKRGPIPSMPGLKMSEIRARIGQLHQLMGGRALDRGQNDAALTHVNQALRYLPDKTRLLRMKGAALFRLEDFDELEQVYKNLYRLQPDSVSIGTTYAQVLLQNQKNTEALMVFESLLERFPREKDVYDALVDWNTRTLNFPGALAVLRRKQEQFPSDAATLRRIADMYEWMDGARAARAVYDSVATLTGDVMEARLAKARSFERQDSLDEAIELYSEALSTSPEKSDLLRRLGALSERQAKWNEALDVYLQLTSIDSTAYPLVRAGRVYERLNRPQEAYDVYRKAYDLGTRDPLPAYRLAALLLVKAGTDPFDPFTLSERALDLSLQAVKEAQEQMQRRAQEGLRSAGSPFDTGPKQQKEELDSRSQLSEEIFQFFITSFPRIRTEPVLLETLRRYPGSGRLHYLVGQFYTGQEEPARAVHQFQETVRFAPELREAHLALGLYYASTGEDLLAIQSYERALTLEPKSSDAYSALITLYRKRNELDRLIDRWHTRYRATPDNVTLREHLIEALHKAGRTKEAQEIVEGYRRNN